jgi:polysaccharide deacetylase family protein (PEP-CTERM system associated)
VQFAPSSTTKANTSGLLSAARRNGPYPQSRGLFVNALTVDVEDYFQVEAFADVIGPDTWGTISSRVEANTDGILTLFADAGVCATFFILGWVAERFPQLVRRISASGHEVASHGHAHQRINVQTPDQFRADIRRAKNVLEDISGRMITGYRAPTFSIGERTWWAYDVLGEEGYAYSSSVYPITHDLYGMPRAPRVPFYPIGAPFLEIPLTTTRLFSRNFPSAGGGYFRLLPYAASRWAMRRVNQAEHMPCIFYCHPWEFDVDQPRIAGASLKSRVRHYTNIPAMRGRVARLLKDFAWGRMDEIFLECQPRPSLLQTSGTCPR